METVALIVAIFATGASAVAAWIAFHAYRAQTDPDVIVYLEHDEKRPSLLLLVIENIGTGVAHDVRFQVPEGFPRDPVGIESSGRTEFELMTSGPLISGIKALPPKGRRILNWGQYGGVFDYLGSGSKEIRVSFVRKGVLGMHDEEFSNYCSIEVSSFAGTDCSRRSEATHLDTIAKTLKKMEGHLGGINKRMESIERRQCEGDTSGKP